MWHTDIIEITEKRMIKKKTKNFLDGIKNMMNGLMSLVPDLDKLVI